MPETLDPSTEDGARALGRLATDRIGWLATVDPDGQPHASPIWFLWENGEVLIYSWDRAPRNGNIEANARVSFNVHTDAEGGDVVTMVGTARIDGDAPAADQHPVYIAKYADMIAGYGWTPAWFAGKYSVPIRITPTRWRLG
jgi:PPOX class probable F420-dependent enzyme